MQINPANELDVPDGTEDTKKEFIPPVDVNDKKFIDLARKIQKLSPETLSMIEKDLQPDEEKPEDTELSKDEEVCNTCGGELGDEDEPNTKDPRAMLIIWLKKVLSQV